MYLFASYGLYLFKEYMQKWATIHCCIWNDDYEVGQYHLDSIAIEYILQLNKLKSMMI